jgi:hypothetical protein
MGISGKIGFFIVLGLLAGCANLPSDPFSRQDEPIIGPADPTLGVIRPVARDEDAPSTETTANLSPKVGALGVTIASLGDAREPGLWLKTPLVDVAQPGLITFGSRSVNVQLLPIDGPETAGSQISLAAMQAIGAPLTGLPRLMVTGRR